MNRLSAAVLLMLIISSQKVDGQTDSISTRILSGNIIDDSLEYALPNVHLWNETAGRGAVSNDSGAFHIVVRNRDTILFSAIGYEPYVMVVSPSSTQTETVRLTPRTYLIDEVVIRRFSSYESFIYQVVHLDLPEDPVSNEMREYIQESSTAAALEADRERAIRDKIERFGYTTPLGKGIDPAKAFQEKMMRQKKREQVIQAKFNRELVGDITHLEGDELTEFIAMCDFSEPYLYETDLYTIVEDIYTRFQEYQNQRDSIPSSNEE